ncbi:MAG: type II secretion system F family protein [Acidimicrobiales bacterium]
MSRVVLSVAGAYGVFLLYTSLSLGWRGLGPAPSGSRSIDRHVRLRVQEWLSQAGLDGVRPSQFAAASALLWVLATALTYALLGALLPALAVGGFAATYPAVSYRARRRRRRQRTAEAWPRLIEEMALLTGALGRSVPQALFEVGARAPEEMRPAFAAAHREWMLTTDFARTVAVLKVRLADATADAACETLLVAYEVGGTDLERRLAALVDDRVADVQGRKDAQARQAGVRFARRFVLLVPIGMALAGLSIGNGREAFGTPAGQVAALAAVGVVIGCWLWSGRIMRLPDEERVFG